MPKKTKKKNRNSESIIKSIGVNLLALYNNYDEKKVLIHKLTFKGRFMKNNFYSEIRRKSDI